MYLSRARALSAHRHLYTHGHINTWTERRIGMQMQPRFDADATKICHLSSQNTVLTICVYVCVSARVRMPVCVCVRACIHTDISPAANGTIA